MDILTKIESTYGYRPFDFSDYILVEIYNKLCDIENKFKQESIAGIGEKAVESVKETIEQLQEQIPEVKPAEDIKTVAEAEKPVEFKVCKHCGKPHDKPQEYAICARRNGGTKK